MRRRHGLSVALGLGLILVGIGCAIAMPKLLGGAVATHLGAGGDLVALVGPDPTAVGGISFAFPRTKGAGIRQAPWGRPCGPRPVMGGTVRSGPSMDTSLCMARSTSTGGWVHTGAELGIPETDLPPDDGGDSVEALPQKDHSRGVPRSRKDHGKRLPPKDGGPGSPVEPDHPGKLPSPGPSAPPVPGQAPSPSTPNSSGRAKVGKKAKHGPADENHVGEKHCEEKSNVDKHRHKHKHEDKNAKGQHH